LNGAISKKRSFRSLRNWIKLFFGLEQNSLRKGTGRPSAMTQIIKVLFPLLTFENSSQAILFLFFVLFSRFQSQTENTP
jgi:hypothetical protein